MSIAATEEASPKEELIVPTPLGGEDGETTPGDTQLSSDEGKEEETLLSGYEREEEGSRVISETYNTQTQGRLTGNLKAQRRLKRKVAKKNRKAQKQKNKAKEKNEVKKEKNRKKNGQRDKKWLQKDRWLDSMNAAGNESTTKTEIKDIFEQVPRSLISHNISCSEMGSLVQTLKELERLHAIQLTAPCHSIKRKAMTTEDEHRTKTSGRKEGGERKNREKRQAEADGVDEEQDSEAELGGERETERFDTLKKENSNEYLKGTIQLPGQESQNNTVKAKRGNCFRQKMGELTVMKVKSMLLIKKWKSECRSTIRTDDENSDGEQQKGRTKTERRKKSKEESNEEIVEITTPGSFAWT